MLLLAGGRRTCRRGREGLDPAAPPAETPPFPPPPRCRGVRGTRGARDGGLQGAGCSVLRPAAGAGGSWGSSGHRFTRGSRVMAGAAPSLLSGCADFDSFTQSAPPCTVPVVHIYLYMYICIHWKELIEKAQEWIPSPSPASTRHRYKTNSSFCSECLLASTIYLLKGHHEYWLITPLFSIEL